MGNYSTSVDESYHQTTVSAKQYVESMPYWGEAISKGGITQTVFDGDGDGICQRYCSVQGLNGYRTVTVGDWYNL
jgi:hypothetical protein